MQSLAKNSKKIEQDVFVQDVLTAFGYRGVAKHMGVRESPN